MSLINDALKRAESEKRAAKASAPTPPLQPVESTPASRTSPLLLGGIFLLGLGAIGIAAALWFGGRTTQVVQTAPAPEPAKVGSGTSPVPADRSAHISTTTQTSSPTPPTTANITSSTVATPTTIASTPVAAVTNTASLPPKATPKPI